jgi:phospholipid-translocating ATPase
MGNDGGGLKRTRFARQPGRDVDDEIESWFDRTIKQRAETLYQTYILELILRRKPLPPSQDGRHIPLRAVHHEQLVDERRGHGYISNSIRSSRYTIWDFLPKQIVWQATRLNNVYFISIGVPQAIPGLSTTGSYTTILPVIFFILLTVLKEGYDDFRRHRLDNVENNQTARILHQRTNVSHGQSFARKSLAKLMQLPVLLRRTQTLVREKQHVIAEKVVDKDSELQWAETKWRNIKVGDIVRLSRDEAVPADIVLLYANGENGLAYVETMALDGETNLKSKQAPKGLRACSAIAGIKACSAEVVAEDPNRDLYDFNGQLTMHGNTSPLTLNEVVFRGSVLRNTGYAIGLVINTGEECKIRMNANHHPKAKKPRLERYANQVVLTLISYVVLLSVGESMGYIMWHQDYEQHAWYLNNAYVKLKQIFIGFLIMFNNVIPLALYVSLEIVKLGQMAMIMSDVQMYDEETNVPMICNTNTTLENLGQVSYVLSDKTGTLTENVMRFRKMSIGGVALSHFFHGKPEGSRSGSICVPGIEKVDEEKSGVLVEDREVSDSGTPTRETILKSPARRRSSHQLAFRIGELTTADMLEQLRRNPSSPFSRNARDFILCMALCHTALPETCNEGGIKFQASSPDELALLEAAQDMGFLMVHRSTHSITLLENDESGHKIRHDYEVLDTIEFSSKRKRMSVLVRCPDGRIMLLCKGADSVIMPRLYQATLASRKSHEVRRSAHLERENQRRSLSREPRNSFGGRPSMTMRRRSSMDIRPESKQTTLAVPKSSQHTKVHTRALGVPGYEEASAVFHSPAVTDEAHVFSQCFRHLDEFATEGLRTLLFAQKVIPQAEHDTWKELFQDATTSLTNRQERIEAAADVIEQGFSLLGASAIEDKLQKGVPETIGKLRRANMKIWMLTGDKRETAINIAHSAQICKPESEMWILDAAKGDPAKQVEEISGEIIREWGRHHSVLVIDGQTLGAVEEDAVLKQTFYSLIPMIDSVICCRASPAQKAGIVRAIRARIPSALTLAIGDGANDIAMIQASHVGVGISGKEGVQAARVADYSIAQFRFLQRLLLVHGRWNYVRTV